MGCVGPRARSRCAASGTSNVAGDVNPARFLFEKLLGCANHVGLCSQERPLPRRHRRFRLSSRGRSPAAFNVGSQCVGLIQRTSGISRQDASRSFPCSARRRPAVSPRTPYGCHDGWRREFALHQRQAPFARKANRPIACNPAHECKGETPARRRAPPRCLHLAAASDNQGCQSRRKML